ncbi:GTP cyclohydrolase I [Anaplasma phagocytophilum]|nr:GTP cyclohydrolase I [Anaplasma phagocytophilum]EOA61095.1 GTP cyclohydrolase I [Anaplasma phagocytophilum str. HGE1]EOA62287.1 GTP cyclohydrolase I [Anaplasma phagocytophilum str. CRT38]
MDAKLWDRYMAEVTQCGRVCPTIEEAEEAVRVIIRWMGDDPNREGLLKTPRRVLDYYKKSCSGYAPELLSHYSILPYDGSSSEMVLVKNIGFSSNCEHHLSPICGVAHIAYMPKEKILGIGSIAHIVGCFSKRLQLQERLTNQVAEYLEKILDPHGVAVLLEAEHWCVECSNRDTASRDERLNVQTSQMLGVFEERCDLRNEFFLRIKM